MLELEDIHASYGTVKVLFGASLAVRKGEILCLLGRNGAGKTTILKTIMGLLKPNHGTVSYKGLNISNIPANEISRLGIGYVPQGRGLFPEFSVKENLAMGLQVRNTGRETLDWVLEIFPKLRERLNQQANTLSGGEQQMLATARALCIQPELLLLDEPTEGLQPSMIGMIRDVVVKMKEEGLAIVLVEQRIDAILNLADQVVVIENGRNRVTLNSEELNADPKGIHKYLAV